MKLVVSENLRVTLILFIFSVLLLGMVIFHVLPPTLFWKYPIAAQNHLAGALEPERLVDFSPLYLYLHILICTYAKNPTVAILWIQILMTSLAAGFLFTLLRRFCAVPIAVIGTLIFITDQSIVVHTGTFEPEPFMICFILAYLVFARHPRPLAAFGAGLCLGLSLVTRSSFFPLILITPLVYWRLEKNGKRCLYAVILFLIPVSVAMSFLIARNTEATGTVTVFGMNPGQVFFEGNNPLSAGEAGVYPPLVFDSREDFPPGADYRHKLYRIFAQRIEGKPISATESNRYWMNKAKRFIFDYPGRFFSTLLTKTLFVFHGFKRHDIWYLQDKDQNLERVLPSLPFAWVAAMAMVGLVLSVKAWRENALIHAVFFTQSGIMLLTYVSERQRVVIIAIMILFAAHVINTVIQKRKRYMIIALSVVVLAVALTMENDVMREYVHVSRATRRSDEMLRRSAADRLKKDWARAAQANVSALAAAPWRQDNIRLSDLSFKPKPFQEQALDAALLVNDATPSARFDLAMLYIANTRLDEAESILRELIQRDYSFNRRYTQSSLPEYHLARIWALRGDSAQALALLKRALHKNPGDPWVLSRLAVMTRDKQYADRIFRYFDDIDAAFFLGRANLEAGQGDGEQAVEHFSYVVDRLPEFRKGFIYLSIALGSAGRYREAVETYRTAMRMRADPLFREKEIIHIFTNYVQENPQDANAKDYLAEVLNDFGYR